MIFGSSFSRVMVVVVVVWSCLILSHLIVSHRCDCLVHLCLPTFDITHPWLLGWVHLHTFKVSYSKNSNEIQNVESEDRSLWMLVNRKAGIPFCSASWERPGRIFATGRGIESGPCYAMLCCTALCHAILCCTMLYDTTVELHRNCVCFAFVLLPCSAV